MNKKEFIRNVAKRSGYSQAKTTEVLDAVLAEMFEAWADHKPLEFRGFGAFSSEACRQGWPECHTGEKIDIPPKLGRSVPSRRSSGRCHQLMYPCRWPGRKYRLYALANTWAFCAHFQEVTPSDET